MSGHENPLIKPEFPRSNTYDPDWVLDNQMGPNALWLIEWLCEELELEPGMRVLDLGCGKALTSVFLAKEFGVTVWAGDLWIAPHKNWTRVQEAGVAERVCPMRLEAHALPFAHGFFDAVVSVDAYTYFGTDDLYLNYVASYLRPGGSLGVVVPGLTQAIGPSIPKHLTTPQAHGQPFWEDECRCFHTAEWWQNHWQGCTKMTEVNTAQLADGWRHWRDFENVLEASGKGVFPSCAEALENDAGAYLGIVRAVARRNEEESMDLYDASVGLQVGVDK